MKRLQRHGQDDGFTLVELLVVVLIIAILAAVAIPMYLGQQDTAKDSAVKNALQTVQVNLQDAIQKNGGDADSDQVAKYDNQKSIISASGYKINPNGSVGTDSSMTYSPGDIVVALNNGETATSYVLHACMIRSGIATYHCFHTDQAGKISGGWQ